MISPLKNDNEFCKCTYLVNLKQISKILMCYVFT